jgi:hypothetical protein
MSRGTIALAIALAMLTAETAASSALAAHPTSPAAVTSTLDGTKVVPIRSRWIAHPRIPASQVSEVDFLIDGKLSWVDHSAPYVYGGYDGLGYLVTTFLSPGEHRFTVRALESNGASATDTVTSRVLGVPTPPAALAGAWTRVVTTQEVQNAPPQYGPPPVGMWKLVFDRVGAWELAPTHNGVVDEYDAEPGVLHVYASIEMAPLICNLAGSVCHGGVSRFGYHTIAGTDCDWHEPFGTYRWAVTGNTLTLTAIHEGCPDRGDVWEGTWTRTS